MERTKTWKSISIAIAFTFIVRAAFSGRDRFFGRFAIEKQSCAVVVNQTYFWTIIWAVFEKPSGK